MAPSNGTSDMDQTRVLSLLRQARTRIQELEQAADEPIAVIGFSGRFPGANDKDELWDLLKSGRSGLRDVTAADLDAAGVAEQFASDQNYIRVWGGFDQADGFDAGFFGYSPREAELLDPQQRAFLECAWSAFEDAGYGDPSASGAVGVYAGAALNGYLANIARGAHPVDPFHVAMGNLNGMVAARTSFHLDLKGPSIGVQTTCSTGLVAVHSAIRGLQKGDCDMALAGAAAINQARPAGYMYQSEGIASPDGICRPFDAQAQGTIFTNGVGALVLKRLSQAQADGDTIHGVILGAAVNNDGADKMSLTAPSVSGQEAVLKAALKDAGVDAQSIDYIEAHGTATALGDPIEIKALARVYSTARKTAISSVKGNLGHLDAAAGMAGLFRVLLSLRHGYLTPTANFAAPNPSCGFENTPFEVLETGQAWPRWQDRPRRAAISAFGIGGTNAHMILQEAPAEEPAGGATGPQLLPLSAQTPAALGELRQRLAGFVDRETPDAGNLAYTLQTGRKPLAHREVMVSDDPLRTALSTGGETGTPMAGTPDVVFVFPGQGTQHAGMARALYEREPVFKAAVDQCLGMLPQTLNLRALLLDAACPDADALNQTAVTQPALFVVEYALAKLWLARGVQPMALLGHSIGEYVAATIAGVFTLEDALKVVCARGRLMQDCAPGAMMSVMMSQAEATSALPDGVEIAAVNAPRSIVLAGPRDTVHSLAQRYDRSAIGCRVLKTSHAFHTAMMDPAAKAFVEVVAGVRLNPPQIDILSNVSGDWMTPEQATDPQYWADQLRQPVQYGASVAHVMTLANPLLLEVGPGSALTRLARQQLSDTARVLASLPDEEADDAALKAMGSLWIAGVDVDWSALHDAPRRRISLPSYPFQRESYWIAPVAKPDSELTAPGDDVPGWFNQITWSRAPKTGLQTVAGKILVLGGADILCDAPEGVDIIRAHEGAHFEGTGSVFQLNPAATVDFRALFADLEARGWVPDHIINGFGLDAQSQGCQPGLLFESTIALAQALLPTELRPQVTLLGLGMQQVSGAETLSPGNAMALGLVPVLPQELAGLRCRALDVLRSDMRGLNNLLLEDWGTDTRIAALRNGFLWTQGTKMTPLESTADMPLKPSSTYLITGDMLQGLGAIYAKEIAQNAGVKLVLIGTDLPTWDKWDTVIATHPADDPARALIQTLRGLGEAGRDYMVFSGDQNDAAWMSDCLDAAETKLGPIAGVFHTAAMGDTFYCPLEEANADNNRQLFQSKLSGLVALSQALDGRQPEFCLLQSSLSVRVGGPGLAGYAAANCFLNAFAEVENATNTTRWQAVEWDVCETPSLGQIEREMLDANLIRPDQLWTATQAILAHPELSHAIVTPANLHARTAAARHLHTKPPEPTEQKRARALSTPFVSPSDAYEKAVAEAMGELLGISQVGARDNFFELGGHSLLAIQIITRLRKEFDVELPIRALLYETPTVEGIAAVIRASCEKAEIETDLLASMLDQIEDQPTEPAN